MASMLRFPTTSVETTSRGIPVSVRSHQGEYLYALNFFHSLHQYPQDLQHRLRMTGHYALLVQRQCEPGKVSRSLEFHGIEYQGPSSFLNPTSHSKAEGKGWISVFQREVDSLLTKQSQERTIACFRKRSDGVETKSGFILVSAFKDDHLSTPDSRHQVELRWHCGVHNGTEYFRSRFPKGDVESSRMERNGQR